MKHEKKHHKMHHAKHHAKHHDEHGHYESAEPMHGEHEDGHKKHHKAKNWIAGAIKHPGALRKELHVKKGHKIPEKKLEKAAHHKGKEGARARMAIILKKMHHKKGK